MSLVLIHIGDLHLVLHAVSLSILDAGILIMVQIDDVLIEHGELPQFLPLAVHLKFFQWTSRGDHSKMVSKSLYIFVGPLLHA